MTRRWTKEENDFLRENYGKIDVKKIGSILNRSLHSVYSRANKALGLKTRRPFPYWTKEEVEFLRDNYRAMSHESLTAHFGRTKDAIKHKANRLGLERRHYYSKYEILDMDETTSAYVAGLFDGDGSIGVYKIKNKERCCVASMIGTASQDFAEHIEKITGLKSYRVKRKKDKFYYQVTASSKLRVAEFLRKVLPYLVLKRRQAELFLNWVDGDVSDSEIVKGLKRMKKEKKL